MVTFIVMNDLLAPLLFKVNRPSHFEIQLSQNLTMKILGQCHAYGQRSRSHSTLEIQRSRSWPRSNPLVTFEACSSMDMFAFRSVAIGTFLAEWDIANSIFDLENSQSRSWPRSNPMVTFESLSSIDMFAFHFVAIRPFLAEIRQIPYLTLKIEGQGHGKNQPKSNHVIYRSGPTIVPKMTEIQKVVQKLSRGQKSAAGGGSIRTGTKTWSHTRYIGWLNDLYFCRGLGY